MICSCDAGGASVTSWFIFQTDLMRWPLEKEGPWLITAFQETNDSQPKL